MKVSIIIRCFNEEEHIGKLLTGIEHQDYENVEVIVVDSGSSDSTVTIASKFETKIIRIKPEEFSFGYALNVGCAAATGQILLFASAHVYPVYDNWIKLMVAPFLRDKNIALVYGKQRGDHRNKYSEHQLFKQWFPSESNYNQKIAFCNNANCAIRKSLWETQPFDELLTGLEDLDWARRIKAKGYKIAYEANAPIIHVHEEKAGQIRNRYRREAMALKKINPGAKMNFFQFIFLFLRNVLHDMKVALRLGELSQYLGEIVMFRFNQFWGTYLGHKQVKVTMNKQLREKYFYPPKPIPIEKRKDMEEHRIKYND
jgi:glycosyltransferase involved in cell wall biosynthesis